MAVKPRLTKKSILAEVTELRKKIQGYFAMTHEELRVEYSEHFLRDPEQDVAQMSRERLIQSLIMRDTYHLTSVLNLE